MLQKQGIPEPDKVRTKNVLTEDKCNPTDATQVTEQYKNTASAKQ